MNGFLDRPEIQGNTAMKGTGTPGMGNRPSHRQPKKGNRSQRTETLGSLEATLGLDMLASALGLKDESLKAIIQGRQPDAESRYFPHISNRLKNAGIPPAILDGLAPITNQVLKKLKGLAANSEDRIPLRRNNFMRLAKAFGERLEVLADALEMNLGSITGVADGTLKLDDQRFGHLNPRLMRAGFPNGWLDEADPELPKSFIDELAKLAVYEEPEDEFVSAPPAVVATAGAQAQLALGTVEHDQRNLATPGTSSASNSRHPADAATRAAPAQTPPVVEKPMVGKKNSDEVAPAAPSKSHGLKGATLLSPGGAPMAPGARLAGRALVGRPVFGGAAASTQSGQSAPAQTTDAPTSAGEQGNDLAESTKNALGNPQLVAAVRHIKKRSETTETTRRTSDNRAIALQTLLEETRRGAKVTLWRELIGKGLPYWGNIRRGGILMKDDLAAEITALLQLPEGWLDNPSFPPKTIAPWAIDANVPLPTTREEAMGIASPSAPAKESTKSAEQAQAAEPKRRGPKPRSSTQNAAQQHTAQPTSAPATSAPAAAQQNTAPQSQAPTRPAAPSSSATRASINWTPAENPQPLDAPGPLTQALVSTIERLAKEGKFTEQDSMNILYAMMNQPGA